MKDKPEFTIQTIEDYMGSLRTMGFDEIWSKVEISDGIIYITDIKNNKSATICHGILSITIYNVEINKAGEENEEK